MLELSPPPLSFTVYNTYALQKNLILYRENISLPFIVSLLCVLFRKTCHFKIIFLKVCVNIDK